jgi:hypothetical protein
VLSLSEGRKQKATFPIFYLSTVLRFVEHRGCPHETAFPIPLSAEVLLFVRPVNGQKLGIIHRYKYYLHCLQNLPVSFLMLNLRHSLARNIPFATRRCRPRAGQQQTIRQTPLRKDSFCINNLFAQHTQNCLSPVLTMAAAERCHLAAPGTGARISGSPHGASWLGRAGLG